VVSPSNHERSCDTVSCRRVDHHGSKQQVWTIERRNFETTERRDNTSSEMLERPVRLKWATLLPCIETVATLKSETIGIWSKKIGFALTGIR
jgi:hypothetical protein